MTALPDKQMMIEAVKLLHPGRVVELRLLNLDGRGTTASYYFDQPLKLAGRGHFDHTQSPAGLAAGAGEKSDARTAQRHHQRRPGAAAGLAAD